MECIEGTRHFSSGTISILEDVSIKLNPIIKNLLYSFYILLMPFVNVLRKCFHFMVKVDVSIGKIKQLLNISVHWKCHCKDVYVELRTFLYKIKIKVKPFLERLFCLLFHCVFQLLRFLLAYTQLRGCSWCDHRKCVCQCAPLLGSLALFISIYSALSEKSGSDGWRPLWQIIFGTEYSWPSRRGKDKRLQMLSLQDDEERCMTYCCRPNQFWRLYSKTTVSMTTHGNFSIPAPHSSVCWLSMRYPIQRVSFSPRMVDPPPYGWEGGHTAESWFLPEVWFLDQCAGTLTFRFFSVPVASIKSIPSHW